MTKPKNSKDSEDEPAEIYDPKVPQEDYSNIEIDIVIPSSRDQKLGWNKYPIDSTKGWNDYD